MKVDVRWCEFFGHVHRFWSYLFGHLHLVMRVFLFFIKHLFSFLYLSDHFSFFFLSFFLFLLFIWSDNCHSSILFLLSLSTLHIFSFLSLAPSFFLLYLFLFFKDSLNFIFLYFFFLPPPSPQKKLFHSLNAVLFISYTFLEALHERWGFVSGQFLPGM